MVQDSFVEALRASDFGWSGARLLVLDSFGDAGRWSSCLGLLSVCRGWWLWPLGCSIVGSVFSVWGCSVDMLLQAVIFLELQLY